MIITEVKANSDHTLSITSATGDVGIFDVKPYLNLEAFAELKNSDSFNKVSNGGYFIEWQCGADLSADTIESKLQI
jgi:hypothetical protein